MIHLDAAAFSCDVHRGEGDEHAGLEDTSLHFSYWDNSDTTDIIHVLDGNSETLLTVLFGGFQSADGFNQAGTSVPLHVLGLLDHVVSEPS